MFQIRLHWVTIASIGIIVVAIVIAAWSPAANAPPTDGVSIGNKQLTSYRDGMDARLCVVPSGARIGVFLDGRESSDEVKRRNAVAVELEAQWGMPGYWIHLPTASLSLWWPIVFGMFGIVFGGRIWNAVDQRERRGFSIVEKSNSKN